jgi:hypothetical protein
MEAKSRLSRITLALALSFSGATRVVYALSLPYQDTRIIGTARRAHSSKASGRPIPAANIRDKLMQSFQIKKISQPFR